MDGGKLAEAVRIAVDALRTGIASAAGNATPAAEPRVLGPSTLEVAILDVNRPRRAFRRITGAALETVLPPVSGSDAAAAADEPPETADGHA